MSGFDINQVTISGNLTRDPELRTLPSGQSVCTIRIAHNDRRKGKDGEYFDAPSYFDVTIWAGLGEWVAGNLAKGNKVVVAGRLRWREYETQGGTPRKPTTTKRQAVDITADSVIPVRRNGQPDPAPDAEEAPSEQ